MQKLMSIESSLSAKPVIVWAAESATLESVLTAVLPHMGEDIHRFPSRRSLSTAMIGSFGRWSRRDTHRPTSRLMTWPTQKACTPGLTRTARPTCATSSPRCRPCLGLERRRRL